MKKHATRTKTTRRFSRSLGMQYLLHFALGCILTHCIASGPWQIVGGLGNVKGSSFGAFSFFFISFRPKAVLFVSFCTPAVCFKKRSASFRRMFALRFDGDQRERNCLGRLFDATIDRSLLGGGSVMEGTHCSTCNRQIFM